MPGIDGKFALLKNGLDGPVR